MTVSADMIHHQWPDHHDEPGKPYAEAVAIADGRIIAVGACSGGHYRGEGDTAHTGRCATRMIDAQGRVGHAWDQ